jgi:hypothetical protein
MKRIVLVCMIGFMAITACKKEETPEEKTTREKIIGMWKGESQTTTITGFPAQTTDLSFVNFEFLSNGTYVSDSAGVNAMTGQWSTPTNTSFVLDSLTFDIKLLTDSKFHIGLDTTVDFGPVPLAASILIQMKK